MCVFRLWCSHIMFTYDLRVYDVRIWFWYMMIICDLLWYTCDVHMWLYVTIRWRDVRIWCSHMIWSINHIWNIPVMLTCDFKWTSVLLCSHMMFTYDSTVYDVRIWFTVYDAHMWFTAYHMCLSHMIWSGFYVEMLTYDVHIWFDRIWCWYMMFTYDVGIWRSHMKCVQNHIRFSDEMLFFLNRMIICKKNLENKNKSWMNTITKILYLT